MLIFLLISTSLDLVHVMLFGVHSSRGGWMDHIRSASTVEVWLHPMVFDLEKEKVMVRPGPLHVISLKLTMWTTKHSHDGNRSDLQGKAILGRAVFFACILVAWGLACSMISVFGGQICNSWSNMTMLYHVHVHKLTFGTLLAIQSHSHYISLQHITTMRCIIKNFQCFVSKRQNSHAIQIHKPILPSHVRIAILPKKTYIEIM